MYLLVNMLIENEIKKNYLNSFFKIKDSSAFTLYPYLTIVPYKAQNLCKTFWNHISM